MNSSGVHYSPQGTPNQQSRELEEKLKQTTGLRDFEKNLLSSIIPRLPDLSQLGGSEPIPKIQKEVEGKLEGLGKKMKDIFGDIDRFDDKKKEEICNTPEFIETAAQEFVNIMHFIVDEVKTLPPPVIVECGVGEAIFTHALDPKPILATDSLATCIGIAGYDEENKSGFLIHFSHVGELDSSGEMLIERIRQMAKGPIGTPIQLHLRGGIARLSEPLLDKIKFWVQSASEKGCPMIIKTQKVLTEGVFSEEGLPNTSSLSLDTRDGSIRDYESSTNPYSKKKMEIKDNKQFDDVFDRLLGEMILEKPEIKIAYPILQKPPVL